MAVFNIFDKSLLNVYILLYYVFLQIQFIDQIKYKIINLRCIRLIFYLQKPWIWC